MLLCCLPVFHPRSRHELHIHPFPLSYPPGSPCPQLQPHGPARQTHACHQIRCLRSRYDRSGPRPGRRRRPPFCRGHRGGGHLPAPGRPGPDHPAPAGLPERRRLAAGQCLRPDAPHHRFRGPGKGRRPEQPGRSLGRGHQAGYGHEPHRPSDRGGGGWASARKTSRPCWSACAPVPASSLPWPSRTFPVPTCRNRRPSPAASWKSSRP